jgi:hypothetical protein
LAYSRGVRPESRSPLANGVAPCQALLLLNAPRSLTNFLISVGTLFAGEMSRMPSARGLGWFSCFMNRRTYRTLQPGPWWNCTRIPSTAGANVGHAATAPWPIERTADASPPFPPRDRAIVKAIACEAVCQTKLPLPVIGPRARRRSGDPSANSGPGFGRAAPSTGSLSAQSRDIAVLPVAPINQAPRRNCLPANGLC